MLIFKFATRLCVLVLLTMSLTLVAFKAKADEGPDTPLPFVPLAYFPTDWANGTWDVKDESGNSVGRYSVHIITDGRQYYITVYEINSLSSSCISAVGTGIMYAGQNFAKVEMFSEDASYVLYIQAVKNILTGRSLLRFVYLEPGYQFGYSGSKVSSMPYWYTCGQ